MAPVSRNIAANFLGAAWIAALTLVVTPLQVNILGVKAYGLVGFIATLQVLVTMLDFGLSATLTRELAADPSEGRRASLPLLGAAASAYYLIALVIGIGVAAGSGLIARRWFHTDAGDLSEIRRGLITIGVYLAFRWPVSLCAGILSGLQRLDLLNLAKVAANSIRAGVGVAVLLIWRSLDSFLVWTALSAAVELAIYVTVCRRAYPAFSFRPGLAWGAVRPLWRDTASMGLLALMAAWLPQLDKLAVSKLMPIEQLGYYSIANNAVAATSLIVTAVLTAIYPAFSHAFGADDRKLLARRYGLSGRVMLFATGLVILPLMIFGQPILAIWVNPRAAAHAWAPMALLALGFWFNAATVSASSLAMACRRPDIPVKVNLATAALYAVGLVAGVRAFGLIGAAAAWVGLNAGYVVLMVPWVHRSVLRAPYAPWLARTFAPLVVGGAACFLLPRLLALRLLGASTPATLLALAAGGLAYAGLGWLVMGAEARGHVFSLASQAHSRLVSVRPT